MLTPLQKRFRLWSSTTVKVIAACAAAPQNPYRYFSHKTGRRYAYATFERLLQKGALQQCAAPEGGRGYHWFKATPEAVQLLEVR